MFKKIKFEDNFNYENIYPTTHDAVCHINFIREESNTVVDVANEEEDYRNTSI